MQGSGFHQPHRHGTFHTDESSPAAAIVSLLTGREVLGKQCQAGHVLMMRHAEVVLALVAGWPPCPLVVGCADSYQEMETASG